MVLYNLLDFPAGTVTAASLTKEDLQHWPSVYDKDSWHRPIKQVLELYQMIPYRLFKGTHTVSK